MKVLSNITHQFESKGFGGTIPVGLNYTLICMPNSNGKFDSIQVIICDANNNLENLVCAMNLSGNDQSLSCTKLVDDMSDEAFRNQQE